MQKREGTLSESIDGLNVQGMFVFEMLPIFFSRHFHREHQNEEGHFERTLSESAPIHYDRGTFSPDTTATTPGDLVLSITARANTALKAL